MLAVCFDFDGLLVDTEAPAYQAWSEIFARYQASLPLEVWVKAVGTFQGFDPAGYLRQTCGVDVDGDALFAEKEQMKARICLNQPLMLGAIERIREARQLGWKTAVVSTSEHSWVHG